MGTLIINANHRLSFVNKEFLNSLDGSLPLANIQSALAYDASKEVKREGMAQILRSLDVIASGPGTTLKTALLSEHNHDVVWHMSNADSKKVYEVKLKSLPLQLNKGCKLAVVKDQTVYQELVKQNLLEKYQRMLLASISHEIRNPLNAIEGFCTILLENQGAPNSAELYERLRQAAQHIDFVIAGACDLMLSNPATLLQRPCVFSLGEAIKSVVNIIRPTVEAKGLSLYVSLALSVPDHFYCDPKKYQLILFHLLTNAAKYTDKGEIAIEVTYHTNTEILSTTVSDTGAGISEDKLPRLFELYANIETANECNPQGMGLGLALCKRLSQLLGGDIHIRSVLGRGTKLTFTVRQLLRGKDRSEAEIAAEDTQENSAQDVKVFESHPPPKPMLSQGKNAHTADALSQYQPRPLAAQDKGLSQDAGLAVNQVLIVDDDATNRLVLKTYLSSIHISADEAENGQKAIQKVEERLQVLARPRYKLILMDINMPVMDGNEATMYLTKLFAEQPAGSAPIIAITAANIQSEADLQRFLSVGFKDIRKRLVNTM